MSNLMDKMREHAAKSWDKNRKAVPGQGGGINLEKGTYVGVQTFEETKVKSGKTKGAPVLIETIMVDTGPNEGEAVAKRYTFSNNKFKDRNGTERTQADTSFEALAKRFKEAYPEKASEISQMDSDEICDMIEQVVSVERRVKFMVDVFQARGEGGKTEDRKFFRVLSPMEDDSEDVDDDDEEDEEDSLDDDDDVDSSDNLDDEEEEDDDDDDDDDESDEDDEDEDAIIFEKKDIVLWKSPTAKKTAEFTVVGVQPSKKTLSLKSARGKLYKNVANYDVELIE